jgi:hypothetical protein
MLNRYHHDRHNLLEFLLSSGSTRSRSGASIDLAGVDLDSVSPDYVIECVLSGTEFLFSLNPFKALFCILLFFFLLIFVLSYQEVSLIPRKPLGGTSSR